MNVFDLGDDPLAYYRKRLQLSRELWQRVQERSPQLGEDPIRQRRVLLDGFRALRDSPALVAKYVGGMYTARTVPGGASKTPAFVPVEPAKQRAALQFLASGLFSADSFRFKPEFLASLTPDYREWERASLVSIPTAVLQLQGAALDRLMSPGTASGSTILVRICQRLAPSISAISPASGLRSTDSIANGSAVRACAPRSQAGFLASSRSDSQPRWDRQSARRCSTWMGTVAA